MYDSQSFMTRNSWSYIYTASVYKLFGKCIVTSHNIMVEKDSYSNR